MRKLMAKMWRWWSLEELYEDLIRIAKLQDRTIKMVEDISKEVIKIRSVYISEKEVLLARIDLLETEVAELQERLRNG